MIATVHARINNKEWRVIIFETLVSLHWRFALWVQVRSMSGWLCLWIPIPACSCTGSGSGVVPVGMGTFWVWFSLWVFWLWTVCASPVEESASSYRTGLVWTSSAPETTASPYTQYLWRINAHTIGLIINNNGFNSSVFMQNKKSLHSMKRNALRGYCGINASQ